MKVHWEELSYPWVDPTFSPASAWIFLRRENVRAQARSWVLARHTGQWFTRGARDPERDDAPEVEYFEEQVAVQNAAWRQHFKRLNVQPYELTYEELVASPEEVVAAIMEYLGLGE